MSDAPAKRPRWLLSLLLIAPAVCCLCVVSPCLWLFRDTREVVDQHTWTARASFEGSRHDGLSQGEGTCAAPRWSSRDESRGWAERDACRALCSNQLHPGSGDDPVLWIDVFGIGHEDRAAELEACTDRCRAGGVVTATCRDFRAIRAGEPRNDTLPRLVPIPHLH